jgi:hypothetical protein
MEKINNNLRTVFKTFTIPFIYFTYVSLIIIVSLKRKRLFEVFEIDSAEIFASILNEKELEL